MAAAALGSPRDQFSPLFFFFRSRHDDEATREKLTHHPLSSSLSLSSPVLGRFLYSLNQFCAEAYGLDVDVGDYHVYEFAKVRKQKEG